MSNETVYSSDNEDMIHLQKKSNRTKDHSKIHLTGAW